MVATVAIESKHEKKAPNVETTKPFKANQDQLVFIIGSFRERIPFPHWPDEPGRGGYAASEIVVHGVQGNSGRVILDVRCVESRGNDECSLPVE